MVRENSPKERQRRQLERKLAVRASYDRILIVSEGSKTEPNYFKEIRKSFRLQTANVQVHPTWASQSSAPTPWPRGLVPMTPPSHLRRSLNW